MAIKQPTCLWSETSMDDYQGASLHRVHYKSELDSVCLMLLGMMMRCLLKAGPL